jgi:LysM repeat protein
MWWKLFILGGLVGSLVFQVLPSSAEQGEPMAVPFSSQMDGSAFAQTDCGPASVAMAINYATGEKLTPLQARQAIMKLPGGGYASNPGSGTAIGDLARIARLHSLETFMGDGAASTGWGPERIRKHLAQGHPVIVLTRLANLPGYQASAQVDHYILLTGATTSGYVYHDPGMTNGARRSITESQLQLAQRTSSVPGQGVALSGPTLRAAAVGEPKALTEAPATATLTVVRGDTLWGIATRLGITLDDLVALNRDRVRNVNQIQVGQVLRVPAPEPASDEEEGDNKVESPETTAESVPQPRALRSSLM